LYKGTGIPSRIWCVPLLHGFSILNILRNLLGDLRRNTRLNKSSSLLASKCIQRVGFTYIDWNIKPLEAILHDKKKEEHQFAKMVKYYLTIFKSEFSN
jgi:hypothetical protein